MFDWLQDVGLMRLHLLINFPPFQVCGVCGPQLGGVEVAVLSSYLSVQRIIFLIKLTMF